MLLEKGPGQDAMLVRQRCRRAEPPADVPGERQERSPDRHRAAHVADLDAAQGGLQRLGGLPRQTELSIERLNGISPTKRNFRHGSIQTRVDYLVDLLTAGGGPATEDRAIGRIKALIWLLFTIGVAALAWSCCAQQGTSVVDFLTSG